MEGLVRTYYMMDDVPLRKLFGSVYHGRRVLVTGATGFKGSWLCMWLHSMGAHVVGFSFDTPGIPCHFDVIHLGKVITDRRGDVRSLAQVCDVVRERQPEIVFHLAAQAIVRQSYEDPIETFSTNVMGTANVLQAIRNCPSVQAVVVITSDKCYENVEKVEGYHEDDRLGGKDPYSASKGCAELVFSAFARSFFHAPNRWTGETPCELGAKPLVASGRAGNVIGGGDWAADRIVPDCVRAWYHGQRPIIRSPHATRPWQHVLEPLSGYLWLGARLLEGELEHHGGSYNFGPLPEVNETVLTLIEAIRCHWAGAAEPDVRIPADAKPEAGLLRLDCIAAAKQLNWKATLNFDETARFTASWFRRFQSNSSKIKDVTLEQISEYASLGKARKLSWASA